MMVIGTSDWPDPEAVDCGGGVMVSIANGFNLNWNTQPDDTKCRIMQQVGRRESITHPTSDTKFYQMIEWVWWASILAYIIVYGACENIL